MWTNFFFIPELILKKNLSDKKETKKDDSIFMFKKEKNKLAIEYIFNDLSDRITNKDIIFIIIASILY